MSLFSFPTLVLSAMVVRGCGLSITNFQMSSLTFTCLEWVYNTRKGPCRWPCLMDLHTCNTEALVLLRWAKSSILNYKNKWVVLSKGDLEARQCESEEGKKGDGSKQASKQGQKGREGGSKREKWRPSRGWREEWGEGRRFPSLIGISSWNTVILGLHRHTIKKNQKKFTE